MRIDSILGIFAPNEILLLAISHEIWDNNPFISIRYPLLLKSTVMHEIQQSQSDLNC